MSNVACLVKVYDAQINHHYLQHYRANTVVEEIRWLALITLKEKWNKKTSIFWIPLKWIFNSRDSKKTLNARFNRQISFFIELLDESVSINKHVLRIKKWSLTRHYWISIVILFVEFMECNFIPKHCCIDEIVKFNWKKWVLESAHESTKVKSLIYFSSLMNSLCGFMSWRILS